MGKALSCRELKAYFLQPTFFTVFSRLQPSLRRQEEEETGGGRRRRGGFRQNESKKKKKRRDDGLNRGQNLNKWSKIRCVSRECVWGSVWLRSSTRDEARTPY